MPQIICPECNHQVNDKVKTCPNCGYPMQNASSGGTTTGMGVQAAGTTSNRTEKHWFIRRDGDELGPFSSQVLRNLAEQGLVIPQTPVSVDKVTWHAAIKVRGLFPDSLPATACSQPSTLPPQTVSPPDLHAKAGNAIARTHSVPNSAGLGPEVDEVQGANQTAASNPPPLPPPVPVADSPTHKDDNSILSPLHQVQRFVCSFTGLKPLTDFKVSYLFSDVLKRRSRADIDTYLNCGCIRTTPEITDVSTEWPRPWFFVRILLFGLLTTLGFGFGTAWFGNLKMVPGLIIVDAFFVPLTCVTIFFELNVPRNISFYQVTKFVVYGGVVSLLISLLLYQTTAIQHTFLGATSAGLVEETAKVLACAVLLRGAQQYKWILNGILIGAAVGAGFAGFESAGYAYESIIHRDVTRVLVALTMRAIFAPFTHVVWTASVVGALWRVKQDRPFHVSMFGERGFLRVLAFVIMLHMLWNSGLLWSMPLKGAALVKSELLLWSVSFVGSWYLVLLLVQEGLRQVAVVKGTSTAEVNEGSMAATKCSECGHNISDKAAACPQCGCFVAAAVESTKSDATSPPLPPGVNYRGTRDQVPRSGLVYPRNPPLTPHLCWLNLSGLGIAQMMHGQAAKGIVQFLAIFLAVVIGAVAGGDVGMDFGFLGVTIASIVDAYMVGKALQCGRPVGKWECFPKS